MGSNTENGAKRLRATTFAIAKLEEQFVNGAYKWKIQYCYCNIRKMNNQILFNILGAPIIFLSTTDKGAVEKGQENPIVSGRLSHPSN